MKVLAVNGSPRKMGSTSQLLMASMVGAASAGADSIRLIHLIDYHFSGCRSCYGCKRIDGGCKGICVLRDDMQSIYQSIDDDTVLILGSPVYYHYITGLMKNFLERLTFPWHTKDVGEGPQIPVGFICTMSQTEENYHTRKYDEMLQSVTAPLAAIYGSCELFNAYDTWHFVDYSAVRISTTEEVIKRKTERYENSFEEEKQRALEFGKKLSEAFH